MTRRAVKSARRRCEPRPWSWLVGRVAPHNKPLERPGVGACADFAAVAAGRSAPSRYADNASQSRSK